MVTPRPHCSVSAPPGPLARHRLAEFPHRQKPASWACFDEGTSGTLRPFGFPSVFHILDPVFSSTTTRTRPSTAPHPAPSANGLPRSDFLAWRHLSPVPQELTASGSTPPTPTGARRCPPVLPVLRRRLAVASRRRGERQTRNPVHVGLAREPQSRRPHPRGGQSHHPFPPQGAIW